MKNVIETCKEHFFISFSMMEKMIDQCPEEIWDLKAGGFVFWQQIVHALSGSNYWMRQPGSEFAEPFAERKVYPELEQDPEGFVSRGELEKYKDEVKELCENFFKG